MFLFVPFPLRPLRRWAAASRLLASLSTSHSTGVCPAEAAFVRKHFLRGVVWVGPAWGRLVMFDFPPGQKLVEKFFGRGLWA